MPTILYFADSNLGGRGATIRLDSGEPCLLSIARTSVRVRKSRLGWFGAILYEEKVLYKAAQTAAALNILFPNDDVVPRNIKDSSLRAFMNAILNCSTCAEVATLLNEAVMRTKKLTGHPIAEI
jgi:hypothetical protein